jgi:hypothetical protein
MCLDASSILSIASDYNIWVEEKHLHLMKDGVFWDVAVWLL